MTLDINSWMNTYTDAVRAVFDARIVCIGLLVEINALVKKNSQFIIATHSPILMAFPNADVYEFSESGVNLVGYKQTEHYQLTRSFLENPERMLHYLLEED